MATKYEIWKCEDCSAPKSCTVILEWGELGDKYAKPHLPCVYIGDVSNSNFKLIHSDDIGNVG